MFPRHRSRATRIFADCFLPSIQVYQPTLTRGIAIEWHSKGQRESVCEGRFETYGTNLEPKIKESTCEEHVKDKLFMCNYIIIYNGSLVYLLSAYHKVRVTVFDISGYENT